jgi:hypothetical protein
MCFLASRLEAGAVTAAELKLAAKLVMALVDRLPPASTHGSTAGATLASDKRYSGRC